MVASVSYCLTILVLSWAEGLFLSFPVGKSARLMVICVFPVDIEEYVRPMEHVMPVDTEMSGRRLYSLPVRIGEVDFTIN